MWRRKWGGDRLREIDWEKEIEVKEIDWEKEIEFQLIRCLMDQGKSFLLLYIISESYILWSVIDYD